MPPRRDSASREALRVQKYLEAEEMAETWLKEAQSPTISDMDSMKMECLRKARIFGLRAERLRLESAKYHGTKSAKAAHNLAIGLIRKNILQKSDKMENKVKLGGWRGLEIFCGEVWHTSRQIKKAFQQIKEESQENPNLKGPVKDMEQSINHLEEASEFLIELGNRLEGWHDLCYSDSEQDDEGDDAEDDDDSDWETLNSQGDEDHDRHDHS